MNNQPVTRTLATSVVHCDNQERGLAEVHCFGRELVLSVVDLAKDPVMPGSLATSVTQKSGCENAVVDLAKDRRDAGSFARSTTPIFAIDAVTDQLLPFTIFIQ